MNNVSVESIYRRIKETYGDEGLVLGAGNREARLLLIGEAPGAQEVKYGRPFSGKAGKNLDEFLSLLGLERDAIYITNAVKFRPVKTGSKGAVSNRAPTRAELYEWAPYLYDEITAINPALIITLGNLPLRVCVSDNSVRVGEAHGKILNALISGKSFPLFALYHPASIIYNPALKDACLNDISLLKQYIYENGLLR